MIDAYGRTITLTSVDGNDIYLADDGHGNQITLSFPQGTAFSKILLALSGNAPPGYAPPALVLNQKYTPQAFGLFVIASFIMQPGLTPAQRKTLATNAGPYVSLALIGDLSGLLALVSTIPVDGVLITAAMITTLQTELNNYLNGL